MVKRLVVSRFVLAGGIIEILVAITHFIMPLQLIRSEQILALSGDYRSFVLLGIVTVGLCLAVFGSLSIYFSRKLRVGNRTAWVYGLSQGLLWLARTTLELILPARIPLFGLSNPTTLVLPLVFLVGMLFLAPSIVFKEAFAVGERNP